MLKILKEYDVGDFLVKAGYVPEDSHPKNAEEYANYLTFAYISNFNNVEDAISDLLSKLIKNKNASVENALKELYEEQEKLKKGDN